MSNDHGGSNGQGLDSTSLEARRLPDTAAEFLRGRGVLTQLSEAVYNHDWPDPREQFITMQSLEKIWKRQMLKDFLVVLGSGGTEILIETVQMHLIKTISILVHIKWEEWSRFESIFFPSGWAGRVHQDRTDESLPHIHEKLKDDSFLGSAAWDFFNKQNAYLPVVIEQGSNETISRTRPLPFIKSKQKQIADGGFGIVTKEVIACYQFRPRSEHISGERSVSTVRSRGNSTLTHCEDRIHCRSQTFPGQRRLQN